MVRAGLKGHLWVSLGSFIISKVSLHLKDSETVLGVYFCIIAPLPVFRIFSGSSSGHCDWQAMKPISANRTCFCIVCFSLSLLQTLHAWSSQFSFVLS